MTPCTVPNAAAVTGSRWVIDGTSEPFAGCPHAFASSAWLAHGSRRIALGELTSPRTMRMPPPDHLGESWRLI
jgi:hypothetical protein